MSQSTRSDDYRAGQRHGLALAAAATAAVAFLSLLGAEKAILAMVLAGLALRGAPPGAPRRRPALWALGLATLYLLLFAVALVLFHAKLYEFIRQFQELN